MSERPDPSVLAALGHVRWEADEASVARIRAGAHTKLVRRRRVERGAAAVVILALGVTGVLSSHAFGTDPGPTVARTDSDASQDATPSNSAPGTEDVASGAASGSATDPTGDASTILLTDGSRVLPELEETELTVVEDTPELVRIRLQSGAALFDVVPNSERVFEVLSGDVRVRVLGTTFRVRGGAESNAVEVVEGRVAVRTAAGEEIVLNTEERWSAPIEPTDDSRARTRRPARAPSNANAAWVFLAREGAHTRAWPLLSESADPNWFSGLLLAADTARFTGHPDAAVRYLRRALVMRPSHARAHHAAMLLGRLELGLGRPAAAARSFGRVRRLRPGPSLERAALLAEIRAWQAAGRLDLARTRARVYSRRFPAGVDDPAIAALLSNEDHRPDSDE